MSAETGKSEDAQQVCIDLPGESVQCWRSGDKLKIILRKHRDVVFDLRLEQPGTYTVESTQSQFYNADKKRLMRPGPSGAISFKDGEKVHVWVAREFQGELLLKYEGAVIMKLDPNAVDYRRYDDAPKTKPAPIIISLGHKAEPVATRTQQLDRSNISAHFQTQAKPSPGTAAANIGEECALVFVCDGSLTGAPEKVLKYFAKGGGKSGLADIDTNDVATRNWILGQLAGAGAYAGDNWKWLRASIDGQTHAGLRLVRAKVYSVRGKLRFYFSGYSRSNRVFGPGGFGPGNERIVTIFAGVGKTASSFEAVGKGVLGTLKGNALVSFVFSSATTYAEWKDDLAKDGYDLSAALLMGLIKALVAAALTVAVVALLLAAAAVVFGASLPVLAVGAITVLIGFGVNYVVDAVDKAAGRKLTGDTNNTDGAAAAIAPAFREAALRIEINWKRLMKLFPRDYEEIYF